MPRSIQHVTNLILILLILVCSTSSLLYNNHGIMASASFVRSNNRNHNELIFGRSTLATKAYLSEDNPSVGVIAANKNKKQGKVSMVGAGPGDPELLTLAAHRIISDPDALIVADRLVSPEIIALCKGDVRTARKVPGCAEQAQMEIYDWCREGLMDGKHVVRLKIGDPFVFGRGGEEVLEFRKMGVEPEVIPGVSAAFAAPLLGGIPVTHRGVSNQVVMCTGYGRNGTSPELIQYHKEQTVVFLMAVGRLRELCKNLVELANYPSDTAVAIVEKAGCPDQRTIVGNMSTIADLSKEYDIKPPSTIVVGGVVNVLISEEGEDLAEHGLVEFIGGKIPISE